MNHVWDSVGEYLDVTEDKEEALRSPHVVGHYRLVNQEESA